MARSDYFAAACSGRWRQDDADIELLADDPDTFNNYVASIYSSDIIVEINIDNAYETMIKTYFLADRLGDRENSNNIISTMIRWELENKCFQQVKNVNLCYSSSTPGSPQRRLLVDLWLQHGDTKTFVHEAEHFHPEFLRDVAVAFMEAKERQEPTASTCSLVWSGKNIWAGRCQYHQHHSARAPVNRYCSRAFLE
nr:hypothetical protein CFP56_65928 [Quercus suber]